MEVSEVGGLSGWGCGEFIGRRGAGGMTFEGKKEGRGEKCGAWTVLATRDLIPIHWRGSATCSESASVCQEIRFESGFQTRRPGDPLNGDGRAKGDRGFGGKE